MITQKEAEIQLRSVFDQIIATGGVKTMVDAIALCELFKIVSGYLNTSPILDEMPT